MFSLPRRLLTLLLILIVLGVFRGWFGFSTPTRDPESKQVNLHVSVDTNRLEADVEKVKAKITEQVARRTDQPDGQGVAGDVK